VLFRHDGSVMGAAVELPDVPRADFELFGESHGRIVATALEMDVPALVQICESHDVPVRVIGRVGGSNLTVKGLIEPMPANCACSGSTGCKKGAPPFVHGQHPAIL
jgi:phosphoribosylformylglycinamidine (FGAM) synthase-like enzyme